MQTFPEDLIVTGLTSVTMIQNYASPSHTVYSARLREYELIYKLSGRTRVHFAGKEMLDEPDTLRYLPAHLDRDDYYVDTLEPGACIFFTFQTSSPMPREALILRPVNPAPIRDLFEKLDAAWLYREPGSYARCLSLVYRIFSYLAQESRGYLPSAHLEVLKRSASYLEQNCFDPDFDYTELARLSGVSYGYYKRLFLAKYGMPPSRYILSLKMNRARALLRGTPWSVEEIARMTGYTDPAYFSRQFRQENGISPARYRRSLPFGE